MGIGTRGATRAGAWYIVGVFAVLLMMSYFDRFILALLANPISQDLQRHGPADGLAAGIRLRRALCAGRSADCLVPGPWKPRARRCRGRPRLERRHDRRGFRGVVRAAARPAGQCRHRRGGAHARDGVADRRPVRAQGSQRADVHLHRHRDNHDGRSLRHRWPRRRCGRCDPGQPAAGLACLENHADPGRPARNTSCHPAALDRTRARASQGRFRYR